MRNLIHAFPVWVLAHPLFSLFVGIIISGALTILALSRLFGECCDDVEGNLLYGVVKSLFWFCIFVMCAITAILLACLLILSIVFP